MQPVAKRDKLRATLERDVVGEGEKKGDRDRDRKREKERDFNGWLAGWLAQEARISRRIVDINLLGALLVF